MNAEAHLRAQGWQGPGTGLRAGSLQRAILTSKKTDLKGLGAKHDESDQWWDKIFSSQLSNITVQGKTIEQVNGGVKAAHPIAARNAHRRQFGERSALEKVFQMGEVLKGSECFIPLAPVLAPNPTSEVGRKRKSDEARTKRSKKHEKKNKQTGDAVTRTLPSPPPSPPLSSTKSSKREPTKSSTEPSKSTVDAIKGLSDRAIHKEARRIRREDRARRRTARQEKRQRKEIRRAARGLK